MKQPTRLEQVLEPEQIKTFLDLFFTFPREGVKVTMHKIFVDTAHIGFVATCHHGEIAGSHIYIAPRHRNARDMAKVSWLFENVYTKLLSAFGYTSIVTSCDLEDEGTKNCLSIFGFKLKGAWIGEYPLT
jgi:hypothetical protein